MFIPNPTARLGEDIASKFLKKKGYKILEKNFRKTYGEIDIVAVKDDFLVFVEVKTRKTTLFGGAIEAISSYKIRKLLKTAQFYKSISKNLPDSLRMDAILIDLDSFGKVREIKHIEDISS